MDALKSILAAMWNWLVAEWGSAPTAVKVGIVAFAAGWLVGKVF